MCLTQFSQSTAGGVWKLQRQRDAWTRQQCAHSVANLCLRATDSRPSSASPVPYVATAQIHPPALFGGRDCRGVNTVLLTLLRVFGSRLIVVAGAEYCSVCQHF
ncbi:hypothetical protein J6590_080253 [Homalodisca vitripennis]|nr:hypothetical protein J6590_080253 [Homalodisca vitripennis]